MRLNIQLKDLSRPKRSLQIFI